MNLLRCLSKLWFTGSYDRRNPSSELLFIFLYFLVSLSHCVPLLTPGLQHPVVFIDGSTYRCWTPSEADGWLENVHGCSFKMASSTSGLQLSSPPCSPEPGRSGSTSPSEGEASVSEQSWGILGNASSSCFSSDRVSISSQSPAHRRGRSSPPSNFIMCRIPRNISRSGEECAALWAGHPGIVYTSERRVCFQTYFLQSKNTGASQRKEGRPRRLWELCCCCCTYRCLSDQFNTYKVSWKEEGGSYAEGNFSVCRELRAPLCKVNKLAS